MSRSEQNVVREMCQAFLHDAVPEYIRDTAYYILSGRRGAKNKYPGGRDLGGARRHPGRRPPGLYAQPDFLHHGSQHPPPVQLFGILHQHMPSCGGPGPCVCWRNCARNRATPKKSRPPAKDWKQSFRSFFSTDMEPEPGKHYLIFRFQPEQGRLLVSFFGAARTSPACPACTTRSRSSRSSTIPTGASFRPSCPWARQIGQHLDYYGHRVRSPTV